MDWEEKAIIQELRQEQRQREMRLRFARPKTTEPSERHALAAKVEDRIIERLAGRWPIHRTTHKAKFDLWIGDCRVEVKAGNWLAKGKYQAHIRNHSADVLIFDAINGTDHFFIIPMAAVAPRRTVEVTSYDVDEYHGQWSDYLEAWEVLEQAVAAAPPRPKQLELFTEGS